MIGFPTGAHVWIVAGVTDLRRGFTGLFADHTMIEVTAGGELNLAGGSGNGYRLADLGSASTRPAWPAW